MSTSTEQLHLLFKATQSKTIAIQTCYIELTNSFPGAILLSHLSYLSQHCFNNDEFYQSDKQLMTSLKMSRKSLMTAKAAIKDFVTVTKKGLPAKNHWKIDTPKIIAGLIGLARKQTSETGDSPANSSCTENGTTRNTTIDTNSCNFDGVITSSTENGTTGSTENGTTNNKDITINNNNERTSASEHQSANLLDSSRCDSKDSFVRFVYDSLDRKVTTAEIARWLKNYGESAIREKLLMLERLDRQPGNLAAWIESALKGGWKPNLELPSERKVVENRETASIQENRSDSPHFALNSTLPLAKKKEHWFALPEEKRASFFAEAKTRDRLLSLCQDLVSCENDRGLFGIMYDVLYDKSELPR